MLNFVKSFTQKLLVLSEYFLSNRKKIIVCYNMAFSGIWNRYACCPENQDNLPTPLENLLIFEVNGYIYRTVPDWFDGYGNRMMTLQFSADARNMYYKFTFYKSLTPSESNSHYYMSTSDDVFPVIIDGVTGREMNVTREDKHNGYTTWKVIP